MCVDAEVEEVSTPVSRVMTSQLESFCVTRFFILGPLHIGAVALPGTDLMENHCVPMKERANP